MHPRTIFIKLDDLFYLRYILLSVTLKWACIQLERGKVKWIWSNTYSRAEPRFKSGPSDINAAFIQLHPGSQTQETIGIGSFGQWANGDGVGAPEDGGAFGVPEATCFS